MGIGLKGLIQKNKSEIIKNWFAATIQTYAPDTAHFYKNQKDQFGNPVGSITSKGIAFLLDQLLNTFDPDAIKAYLDPIIRIRAIQDFSPSQATGFILLLKKILRENLANELQNAATATQFLAFESKSISCVCWPLTCIWTVKKKYMRFRPTRRATKPSGHLRGPV